MKKVTLPILISLLLFAPVQQANAFFDAFICYGKRNNEINAIILDTLDTQKTKWKRAVIPYPHEFESSCTYILEGDNIKNADRKFIFTEMHYAKHPTIHSMDGVFSRYLEAVKDYSTHTTRLRRNRDSSLTKERLIRTVHPISRNANTIQFEIFEYKGEQLEKDYRKENLFGEKSGEITYESEKVQEKPIEYDFVWIIDLGKQDFRSYIFRTKKQIPTEEEKKYLL